MENNVTLFHSKLFDKKIYNKFNNLSKLVVVKIFKTLLSIVLK